MTNFVELAMKSDFDRDLLISVYKAINGGYYLDIYYSSPPCLAALDSWPRKYFTKRMKTLAITKPEAADVLYFYAYLDLYALYTMSSLILGRTDLDKQIELDLRILKDYIANNLGEEPRSDNEFKLLDEAKSLGEELSDKRLKLRDSSLEEIINEIAYNSKTFENLKRTTPWAKAVSKNDSLKSLFLAGMLDDFVSEVEIKLKYLASELYMDFDRILLSNGIVKTLQIIRDLNDELLKENYYKIVEKVRQFASYI